MPKTLLLCATILCLAITASAQDVTASLDTNSPAAEPAAPSPFHVEDRAPWQLGLGYQYQHFKPLGQSIHTNGYNVDITRFF
jgi:hypothetical protein